MTLMAGEHKRAQYSTAIDIQSGFIALSCLACISGTAVADLRLGSGGQE